MDPLTAVSLAGTVVQFVDFSSKLISVGSQLYEEKELESHKAAKKSAKQIQQLATSSIRNLKDYTVKLQPRSPSSGQSEDLAGDEALLEDVCRKCKAEAEILIDRLEKLQVSENAKNRAWQSMEKALISVWSKKDIDRMVQKLSEYRTQINSQVLLSLSKRLDLIAIQQSEQFKSIGTENQQITSALLNLQHSLAGDLQVQITALSQLLDRSEVVITDHDDRTRKLIVNVFEKALNSEGHGKKVCSVKEHESETREAVGEEILESLRFQSITERFEEVAEAHKRTFQWIFQKIGDGVHVGRDKQWSDFPAWLQHENGLYWINGKAASGKSTLMKYIFIHPQTHSYLKTWAGNSPQATPLYIAGFFFWLSGTKEQKTQIGLLRSLLHDILQQNPRLIPIVFPRQWSARYSAKLDPSAPSENVLGKTWLLSSLKVAFQILLTQTQVPIKLCLFIDGLDEYDGDETEIAILFGEISKSSNVKCCVSSRPHLPFQDAFGDQPGLRLEDLTMSDIRRFVQDELEDDERMKRLSVSEPREARKLIDEIVTAANGVFLWVKLVVASLLKGLGNHDQISDLQARLRVLPRKLEDLYVHMILRVDESYQKEASRLYQLVAAATNSRDDDWRVVSPLSIFALSLAEEKNPDLVLTAKSRFLTPAEIHSRCKIMASRLTSRSGGLLEIQHGSHPRHKLSPAMKVSYLHRTVKDCLEKWDTQTLLKGWTGGSSSDSYSPNMAILKSNILQLKSIRGDIHDFLTVEQCTDGVILYARRVEADTGSAQKLLMDEFLKVRSKWKLEINSSKVFYHSPPVFTVQCGLCRYLRAKLETENVKNRDAWE